MQQKVTLEDCTCYFWSTGSPLHYESEKTRTLDVLS